MIEKQALVIAGLAFSALCAADSGRAPRMTQQDLIGAWRLVDIEVQGPATDILIENNRVEHSAVGINISNKILLAGDEFKNATGAASAIMLRRNRLVDVAQPLVGDGIKNAMTTGEDGP